MRRPTGVLFDSIMVFGLPEKLREVTLPLIVVYGTVGVGIDFDPKTHEMSETWKEPVKMSWR
jgi:hypothetical protein